MQPPGTALIFTVQKCEILGGMGDANMRKILILGVSIMTALSVAGCAGTGKTPIQTKE